MWPEDGPGQPKQVAIEQYNKGKGVVLYTTELDSCIYGGEFLRQLSD
jgi:hypothetical protein